MLMNPTPLFIASRLRLSRKGQGGGVSTGVIVAIAGIGLAIVVMMVSIAVMNGFRNEIKRKVTGFEAQITVQLPPPASDMALDNGSLSLTPVALSVTPALDEAVKELNREGYALTPVLTSMRPMMLKTDSAFKGVVAKGADTIQGLDFIGSQMVEGTMPDLTQDVSRNSIVISRIIADELDLKAGDDVQAYFFGDGNMKVRKLTVSGVYDTHFVDYDRNCVFTSLSLLRSVDKLANNEGTRLELSGIDDSQVTDASRRLQTILNDNIYTGRDTVIYQVDNVRHRGALYYNWLDLLDTNVTVILILMSVVAGFTLISSLFIIILERVNMIGILKALGASNSFIRQIFIAMSERIVLLGMLAGNLIGLPLLAMQHYFHLIPLDPATYNINYVPVEFTIGNFLWLNAGVLVIALLVLILPSSLVAKISPARSIRFE